MTTPTAKQIRLAEKLDEMVNMSVLDLKQTMGMFRLTPDLRAAMWETLARKALEEAMKIEKGIAGD